MGIGACSEEMCSKRPSQRSSGGSETAKSPWSGLHDDGARGIVLRVRSGARHRVLCVGVGCGWRSRCAHCAVDRRGGGHRSLGCGLRGVLAARNECRPRGGWSEENPRRLSPNDPHRDLRARAGKTCRLCVSALGRWIREHARGPALSARPILRALPSQVGGRCLAILYLTGTAIGPLH